MEKCIVSSVHVKKWLSDKVFVGSASFENEKGERNTYTGEISLTETVLINQVEYQPEWPTDF
jgi:hypothetical protein